MKIRRKHAPGPEPVPDWQRRQEERNRELDELNERRLAERRREARAERKSARKQRRVTRKAARKARRAARPAPRAPVPGSLRVPRAVALWAIACLVTCASSASFAESYRGLFDWAHEHGLSGGWAALAPLMVDVFIAVGELALFVALCDQWNGRSRIGAWLVTMSGLALSTAGNVGHVHGKLLSDRVTAGVPPVAAAAALAVGLGVLKRVVQAHGQKAADGTSGGAPGHVPASASALNGHALPSLHPGAPRGRTRARARSRARSAPVTAEDAEHEFMTELASGTLPSLRTIRSRLHVGGARAKQFQEHLEAVTRT